MNSSEDWTSQVRRGIIDFCVLTLVSQKPTYGYELVTTLSKWGQLAATEGTVYPLLRRLQKDLLIKSSWIESEAGPPRKYYQLTSTGEDLLSRITDDWDSLVKAINELRHMGDEC